MNALAVRILAALALCGIVGVSVNLFGFWVPVYLVFATIACKAIWGLTEED